MRGYAIVFNGNAQRSPRRFHENVTVLRLATASDPDNHFRQELYQRAENMDFSLSSAASELKFVERLPVDVDTANYIGKLLLPGNDLTIVVTANRVTTFVDGRSVKIGRAPRFIDNYLARIRTETKPDLDAGAQQINIIGVWHDNGPNRKSFEPYLVQKKDSAGNISTSLYRYMIFHFDHHCSGEKQQVTISEMDGAASVIDGLKAIAEQMIGFDNLPDYVWQNGHPAGVLWCPVPGSNLPPFVYSAVGLKKFRTRQGQALDASGANQFDAESYHRKRSTYFGMMAQPQGLAN
ncbi:hypothetical protein [Rhizobium leguminosarum]|uniref:hypothetical protein n=2 Tax=Rhizobium leguminosarum TaxID=384 RepID=UPI001441E49D|nr:hypothetical protein [Rhizobium leguminosarum]MBY5660925.1 hypothetical protein [Rhizobium leguminosarum]MBY5674961.1 hypothetical protein [Rhizobium leguminosarum]MBY5773026.1 hypothetical protein [Rhizobium leguminosarum]NKL08496.1 hypothetical protein [Rhizobium leguminosarum bv. viciae]NKL90572.1 hypothetical protein [Rhizobium leguminosarum bv. viciae]